jgi:hypothetical protein
MQTFLPLANFRASAEVLDMKRLGNQRVEAAQLVRALTNGGRWAKHPAAIMWSRDLAALKRYHDVCISEWERRGYRNTMKKFHVRCYSMPIWFGDEEFHSSHRAALLAKNPEFYRRYDWKEQPVIDYAWPTYCVA